jgi:hypothetical protein
MNRSRKWQKQPAVASRKAFVGTALFNHSEMAEERTYLPPASVNA